MSLPAQLQTGLSKLTPEEQTRFAAEIEGLRASTVSKLGSQDARYIRNVVRAIRWCALGGRSLLMVGAFLPTPWWMGVWALGAVLLACSKILDNMELGHNVIHGQFNWMNEPRFNGKLFEWDIVGTAKNWRWTHNYKHHTYTNVHGADDDIGYGVLRLFPEQRWSIFQLGQPLYALIFALFFQWGVAIQALKIDRLFKGRTTFAKIWTKFQPVGKKMSRQLLKDYVLFPLLAGPGFLFVFTGNLLANGIRNVWTYVVIFCGHFTANAETFNKSVLKNESRAQWYERQIRGSSNLSGGFLLNVMTGNLSHQIEHHLYPDVPANRYAEMAPIVKDICLRYGIPYNTGSMRKQFSQVIWRFLRHSLPSRPAPMAPQLSLQRLK